MRHLDFFRHAARLEEQMIRAAMPRTAAADPAPLKFDANRLRADAPAPKTGFALAQVARVQEA